MSKSSSRHGGKGNVQNVGKVGSGSGITRAGRKTTPENQRVSAAGHAPSPVKMPGQSGDGAPLTRSGPVSRGRS